eukprot:CAMPEP_0118951994 /NCGR_PEP_ID=MMETSP1169-20130426/54046_1 /TAXON_ID=36882 /ORGANISM="Pyramimonas obovata, Strain CCMP722" /LENGTH=169 /DNA_ID=CAMNT_0006899151 /DNA_START=45 /DNA_END=551 /DNA_ORIENTATION=-
MKARHHRAQRPRGRICSLRQLSAILWVSVLAATLWQFWVVPRSDLREDPAEAMASLTELNSIRDRYGEGMEVVEDDVSNEAPGIERDPKEVAAWMSKMGTAPSKDRSDDKLRKAPRRDKSKKRRDSARDETVSEFDPQKPIVLGATPTSAPKPSPTPKPSKPTVIAPEK